MFSVGSVRAIRGAAYGSLELNQKDDVLYLVPPGFAASTLRTSGGFSAAYLGGLARTAIERLRVSAGSSLLTEFVQLDESFAGRIFA